MRTVVFYLFLSAYLLACPLTILYALGYVVQPGPPLDLVETGLIHLATLPAGASVYLEGSRYAELTPTALRKLLPGEYHLRLFLAGHHPWERVIRVEAEKAQVLDKILLLPNQMRRRVLALPGCESLIPVPDTRFIVITRGLLLGQAVLYNWKTDELKPLVPEGSVFWESRVGPYRVVPGSPILLLNVRRNHKRPCWIRLDLENTAVGPEVLPDLFLAQPGWITWSPRSPNRLFTLRQGCVDRLDMESVTLSTEIARGVRGYGVSHSSLILLSSGGSLKTAGPDGKTLETILADPEMIRSLFGDKERFRITSLPGDLLLFLGENGRLVTNRLPYQLAGEGIRGFQLDPRRERLLVWSRDKIGVVDFSVSRNREPLFEKGPSLTWVFRKGRDIQQAFWVYDGSHILFRDRDWVSLMETETSGEADLRGSEQEALHPLLQLGQDIPTTYSEERGALFYLDRQDGALMALELVPRERTEE